MAWEHFAHGADIGVRGSAATKAAAFEEAGLALTAVVADPGSLHATVPVEFRCAAPDDELLLVDWLNAIVYEMATRKILFGRYAVTLAEGVLAATGWGQPIDRAIHRPAVEVKGATFTELAVRQAADGSWIAQCVVDV